MKLTYIITILVLFGSCSPNEDKESKSSFQSKTTLIFIDKSISVDVNKLYISNKFQIALNKIIEENITNTGDKLEMYYIHENTSKARCFTVTCRTSKEETNGMSETDKEAANTNYELSIRKERSYVLQQAKKYLMAENTNRSNLQTDIWATFQIMDKETKSNNAVKAYYFSDMVESMNGENRRDFHVKPPNNEEEAFKWAKLDAEKMVNLDLSVAQITMILPFDPMSSSKENSPYITHYWNTLFTKLGVQEVVEN